MRYRILGGSGIEVSTYCLGTMMFGAIGNQDPASCARIVHTALDHGVNFVDTADMYGAGESETILGKALAGGPGGRGGRREEIVLASKFHFPVGEGPGRGGNSRRWIVRAVEDSLRRLGTDRLDLYQVHRPDRHTDIEETLSALTDLVRAGKILSFGCSTFPAEDIAEAQAVSERRGLHRFRTEQPPYSLLARGVEAAVLPTARRYGMGVLTWGPLASGFLTGRYREGRAVDLGRGRAALNPERFAPERALTVAKLRAVEQLTEVAEDLGRTLPELALAFPLAHPAVTSVILGPRTEEQLESALKAATLTLDDETLDRIDAIVAPGTDVYPPDGAWARPSLTDPAQRRRPLGERAATD